MFMFRVLHTVPYSNAPSAQDIIAMVHSYITANMLIIAALILSARQFGGKPIECMVPSEFTQSWIQYAENYCWSQETYFVPFTSAAAGLNASDKVEKKVSSYQWMPFFLLFQAACFKMPCLIWRYFATQSGMRMGEILRLSSSDANGVPEVKKANIEALGTHLNGALRFHKILNKKKLTPHKFLRFLNLKYSMHYVTLIYFVAKLAFVINVGWQAKLLEKYVLPKTEENIAIKTWKILVTGNETWKETGIFPRVALCDFETREMGNVQNHTVQCLLLMNIFTEKVFLILWAWFVVLLAFTVLNLVSWMWCMGSETTQFHFILSHLEMADVPFDKKDKNYLDKVSQFLSFYLGCDGLLVLFLVSQHADVIFTSELIVHLWTSFTQVEQQRVVLKRFERVMKEKISIVPYPESPVKIQVPGPLKRAYSLEGLEAIDAKKFDESSSDDEDPSDSNRSSKKATKTEMKHESRKNSLPGTPKKF